LRLGLVVAAAYGQLPVIDFLCLNADSGRYADTLATPVLEWWEVQVSGDKCPVAEPTGVIKPTLGPLSFCDLSATIARLADFEEALVKADRGILCVPSTHRCRAGAAECDDKPVSGTTIIGLRGSADS